MKALIFTLTVLIMGANSGLASSHPTKQIIRYENVQEQTIELPTHFAKPFIIDQKDIELLAGKKIHHVELVYTKYAKSANFNQKELNTQRITQLKKLLPQVNSDNPAWTLLEQTGATTRKVAADYFHGFVIHYGDKLDHNQLGEFFSEFAGKKNEFNVYYPEGGSFNIASGTTINIDQNAVSYMDGSAVSGYYTLYYTEYRNQAEIALSGLPMDYENANFSSIGMYELRAEKDGKELKLIEPMKVDFNCTKIVDDAAFYSMNDETGEWKKHHDIDFGGKQTGTEEPKATVIQKGKIGFVQLENWNMNIQWQQIDDKTTKAKLDDNAWWNFEQIEKKKRPKGIVSIDSVEHSFIIENDKTKAFEKKVFAPQRVRRDRWFGGGNTMQTAQPNNINATLLGKGSSDPGHTYPSIVRGLNSPNFGVYNCDQVYRIGEIAHVSPVYKNAETGQTIRNGFVTCVMDLSYNGSFSFHPNNLVLNKNGKNAILLFTKKKEIYLIDEAAFKQLELNTNKAVELPMKNVTSELKSPDDLKKMLNI